MGQRDSASVPHRDSVRDTADGGPPGFWQLIESTRQVYEAALRDPDSLAPIVQDAEQGDWENADSVAGDAYESATGEEIPRYPQLAARFR